MTEFHVGTFVWGLILTISGAALAVVGFGWWDMSDLDLRYAGPVFVLLIGAVILLSALRPWKPAPENTETENQTE